MAATEQNLIFIKKAKEWVDVPFCNQQSSRFGCDCAGLLIGIGKEMGYDVDCFNDLSRPLNAMSDLLEERFLLAGTKLDDFIPGCCVTFFLGRFVQHCCIFIGDNRIIHSDRQAGKVTLIDFPERLLKRKSSIFQLNWDSFERL